MRLYVAVGDTLRVPYPGGTAPGSTTWRYRDGEGLTVGTLVNQSLTANAALIPATAHTLTGGALFAYRYLQFSDRMPELISVTVTNPYMLTANPAAARALIGFNEAEIADEDLDFTAAALALDIQMGGSFRPLLATSPDAQRLVLLDGLLGLEASMRARVAQSMSTDAVAFSRFRDLDVGDILDELKAQRHQLASSLLGTTAILAIPVPTVFTLGATRTDPFPGA